MERKIHINQIAPIQGVAKEVEMGEKDLSTSTRGNSSSLHRRCQPGALKADGENQSQRKFEAFIEFFSMLLTL